MIIAIDQNGEGDDSTSNVARFAQDEARRLGHNFVGTEQILLALIRSKGRLEKLFEKFGITLNWMRGEVERRIGRGSGFVAVEIPYTPRAKRVLELSWLEAKELGHNFIGPEHLMLAILREGEGVAWRILSDGGISTGSLRQAILKLFDERD